MATTGLEVFDKTLHTTNLWLDEISAEIGPDRHLAWHVLGAVLRSIRDEMQVEQSAHFAAQLPLLVRGAYFDQYRPAVQPASERSQEDFVARIHRDLDGSRPVKVEQAATAVMRTLNRHVTEGQIRKVRDALSKSVRAMWPEPEHKEPEHPGSHHQKSDQRAKSDHSVTGQSATAQQGGPRPTGQPASSGQPAAPQHSEPQHAAPPSPQHAASQPPPRHTAPPPSPQRAAPQHFAAQGSAQGRWEDIDAEEETSLAKSTSSAHVPIGAASPPYKMHAAPAAERTASFRKPKARAKRNKDDVG
jgi:uncharacterized protein (DUF2267 family)